MRIKAKVDANQSEIVEALRFVGATVQLLHREGGGCPDLLVGFRNANFLLEVKGPKGKLTPHQVQWHQEWKGKVRVVTDAESALDAIGVLLCKSSRVD